MTAWQVFTHNINVGDPTLKLHNEAVTIGELQERDDIRKGTGAYALYALPNCV
jgi:hypothetical protein